MAYVGRTELLCQAIVSHDLEAVKQFLDQEDSDPDRRDYTGRTPLQLACMSSTPEIVQCLVDRGARMIARMADGQTALHLAAARGATEIVSILLKKSNENEEAESRKTEDQKPTPMDVDSPEDKDNDDEDEDDMDATSHTSASYVKVDKENGDESASTFDTIEENDLDPDIYDINVTAWDNLASPLHLAIVHGHVETVKELVTSFGADVLLPIKIVDDYSKQPRGAILTLVLVLALPLDKAREMSKTLLKLGASPAQADTSHYTVLHYIAQSDYSDLLDVYQEHDGPAMQRALNHLVVEGSWYSSSYNFSSALVNALCAKNPAGAKKLLNLGAKPSHELGQCLKALKSQMPDAMRYGVEQKLEDKGSKQPIIFAIENNLPLVAIDLLQRGVDPNTEHEQRHDFRETALDCTKRCLEELENSLKDESPTRRPWGIPDGVIFEQDEASYLADLQEGSYKMFAAKAQLKNAKENNKKAEEYEESLKEKAPEDKPGEAEKREAVAALIKDYGLLKAELLSKDAKTWQELHPGETQDPGHRQTRRNQQKKNPKKTFKVEFFSSLASLSDAERDGYENLYVHNTRWIWNKLLTHGKQVRGCMERRSRHYRVSHPVHVGTRKRSIALANVSSRCLGTDLSANLSKARSPSRCQGHFGNYSGPVQGKGA
jgi:ankyrin repeat protein